MSLALEQDSIARYELALAMRMLQQGEVSSSEYWHVRNIIAYRAIERNNNEKAKHHEHD